MRRLAAGVTGWAVLGFCLATGAEARPDPFHAVWAITGARVVTMAGSPIASGTVVVRSGLIEAVGATIDVPADAEVIDGAGLTVYPGLIDGLGDGILKLPERKPAQRSSSEQRSDEERGITPELEAWEYANLGKATLAKHHAAGLAAVQVMPTSGVLPGRAAVLCLSGEEKVEALLLRESALGMTFTPGAGYPNSLMGVVAFIRQELSDAAYYGMHASRWQAAPLGVARPVFSGRHEILARAAAGSLPVIFVARNQNDIRRALGLRSELGLDAIVADLGGEAFRVLPEIRKAGVKLLLSVTFKAPASALWSQQTEEERKRVEQEVYPANASKVAEAGITFAFASLGSDGPEALLGGVRKAIEAGLPAERALRAMTADAAAVLGVGRVLGTLEAGKIANLVVADGDPLAPETRVKMVFADGRRYALKDRKLKDGDAPTVNVTGRWELTPERGMGAGSKTLVTFTQEEGSLSGTYATRRGDADFTDGEVAGNQIAFEVSMSFGSRSIELFVSGVVEGDIIRGSITSARGSNPFTARRIP